MERLEHSTIDLLYGLRFDLDAASCRYPWRPGFPQNNPTAIGRQDFHCFLQGHKGNLISVGQSTNLRSQGIPEIQLLIHRQQLYREALHTAAQRFDVVLWRWSRHGLVQQLVKSLSKATRTEWLLHVLISSAPIALLHIALLTLGGQHDDVHS